LAKRRKTEERLHSTSRLPPLCLFFDFPAIAAAAAAAAAAAIVASR